MMSNCTCCLITFWMKSTNIIVSKDREAKWTVAPLKFWTSKNNFHPFPVTTSFRYILFCPFQGILLFWDVIHSRFQVRIKGKFTFSPSTHRPMKTLPYYKAVTWQVQPIMKGLLVLHSPTGQDTRHPASIGHNHSGIINHPTLTYPSGGDKICLLLPVKYVHSDLLIQSNRFKIYSVISPHLNQEWPSRWAIMKRTSKIQT